MTHLNDYLIEKRAAVLARKARIEKGELGPQPITAKVSAEGRSGIRRIRIRDFQVVTDSPPDFAGYNLGPSSPELQLGVLGSCLTHSYLIQAAIHKVPIEALEVEVTGTIDGRGSHPDFPQVPVHPHDLSYTVRIVSSASAKVIASLEEAVERFCPILNLLKKPQAISGSIDLIKPSLAKAKPAKPANGAAKAAKPKAVAAVAA
ncbi:MAG: OsmC family protein [Rhizobiales bacterium]|nr:OsmC family protein [Hyphomicrobiales bacterium]